MIRKLTFIARRKLARLRGLPTADAVVHRAFVQLAFKRLRLGYLPTDDEIEEALRLVDSGALDAVIERYAPGTGAVKPAHEKFTELQAFDYAAWKRRHGVSD